MKKILLVNLCLLLLCISEVFAQTRTVTGVVTSKDDGLPLPGVTVRATGGSNGTQTNGQGRYTLAVPASTQKLEFVYVGYSTLTASLGSGNELSVSLAANNQQLNEVIVTAAGLQTSRRQQGVSLTTVKSEQLTQAKPTNVAAGLIGKVPGLQISGTTGGVNPNFRVVLRGARSLTGNNEALIVLDNVIVPNALLSNLNPEDVQDIQVLQGASAAALYGSDASNGALIITTKKGKKGAMDIKAQQTFTVEQVAFFPQLQKKFGSGSDNDLQIYLPYENQQYGPAFNGQMVDLGLPLANGNIQRVPYSWTNDKYNFWQNGLTSQSDLSISSGDDKGTLFISGQYADTKGTLPKDKFNRANVRINGTRNFTKNFTAVYGINYTQNRYDQTSGGAGTIYDQLLNSPGQAPSTTYKDWRNDPYADPSGYYNAYYNNPYFTIDNYRQKTRNDYLTGNLELKYSPAKWVDLLYRTGLATRNNSAKTYSDIYRFNDYIKARPEVGNYKKTDIVGGVTDAFLYTASLTNEFQATFKHQVKDFKFNLVTAYWMRQQRYKTESASVSGLVQAGLFNLANSTNQPTAGEANYLARQQAVYGVLNVSYKNYLFLNVTGRNDWTSVLAANNRSFFYPGVNVSFVPTDAIAALKNVEQIDFIKLRAGYSKVGNVNLGGSTYGAYRLDATFGQGSGYPFNGLGGFTLNNSIVAPNIKPEFTYEFETGVDMSFLKDRVTATVTYYDKKTKNQTVTANVSNTTGYGAYFLNAGTTSSYGIESTLNLVPIQTKDWRVSVGGNFSYLHNQVDELFGGLPNLNISGGTPGSYGIVGSSLPTILGRAYVRDNQGRVIVNRVTGYPSGTSTLTAFGNASPTKILGLNLGVNYKGLSLSTVAEYRAGYVIYQGAGTGLDFNGAGINTIAYDRERFVFPNSSYLDPNTNTYVANTNITVHDGGPAYWTIAGPRRNIDENYIVPGNFWKLREVSLAYTLPKSWLGKTKFIKAATLSAQGRNLFIWTPKTNVYTDPEYSANDGTNNGNGVGVTALTTPPSRYYGGTISITF
ncbi:SusC/RagA family TonB-linked outer membrane protein [Mucilaginibacter sp. CSA2-8R]|uniref:SusC/RagA family TonB-linked outer membrane protein n=1 Tax=Mucilaginibacter sp. CSA2-8R TaxID=3141542 RepID=UPI00315C91C6